MAATPSTLEIVPVEFRRKQRNDFLELHRNSPNSMHFASHAAQLGTFVRHADMFEKYAKDIMQYCPEDGEQQKKAVAFLGHHRSNLMKIQRSMGGIMGGLLGLQMNLLVSAKNMWDIMTNPAMQKNPDVMMQKLVGKIPHVKDLEMSCDKMLSKIDEVIVGASQMKVNDSDAMDIADVVREVMAKYGGAKVPSDLEQRLAAKAKAHSRQKQKCVKIGQELATLRGEEVNAAIKLACAKAVSEETKQTAKTLNQWAEEARQKSTEASWKAADAADKRWHTRDACGSSRTTVENTAEQEKQRAQRFRAHKELMEADVQAARDQREKRDAILSKSAQEHKTLEEKIVLCANTLATEITKCNELRAELDDLNKQIAKLISAHGGITGTSVAKFRHLMQELPRQLNPTSMDGAWLGAFWMASLKEYKETCRQLHDDISVWQGKESRATGPMIAISILPTIEKLMLDPKSALDKTNALNNALSDTEFGKSAMLALSDAGPDSAPGLKGLEDATALPALSMPDADDLI